MKTSTRFAAGCLLTLMATSVFSETKIVTLYSADGLHDGTPSWYEEEFAAFTKETGITVQYVEAGSGAIVDRLSKEKTNVQADVLVTIPPFMQKAAEDNSLQAYRPVAIANIIGGADAQGRFEPMVINYPNFIYNTAVLKAAPTTYLDLLDPRFKRKVQYSTPGQAGDGTALMIQVFHAFGSKQAGYEYLKKLQINNLGPSASTGKLSTLVNKGELYVANGDLQMNLAQMADNPNIRIFFPTGPDGKKTTFALPYYIGLVAGGPHSENGKKLIDFLLGEASQKRVSAVARGLPARGDVHPNDESYKELRAKLQDVMVWSPNWAQVLIDLKSDVATYNQTVGNN